jgi:hypothetical protein
MSHVLIVPKQVRLVHGQLMSNCESPAPEWCLRRRRVAPRWKGHDLPDPTSCDSLTESNTTQGTRRPENPPNSTAIGGSRSFFRCTQNPTWPDPCPLWYPRRGVPAPPPPDPRGTNCRRHRKDTGSGPTTLACEIELLRTKIRTAT